MENELLVQPKRERRRNVPAELTTISLTDIRCEKQLGGLLKSGKAMVNVGSVGQPRDGDSRSCYVLLSDDHLEFRRVEYDFEKTAAKIYAIPELDNFLGERLTKGQ